MRTHPARIVEIRLLSGQRTARIECPSRAIPRPGQYILALDPENILGAPLFFAGDATDGFLCAPPIPITWAPGISLTLYGPLGRGFQLPARSAGASGPLRIALIAAGDSPVRILPLAIGSADTASAKVEVALFSNAPLPQLPMHLEAFPLGELSQALEWADFLAIDAPADGLGELRERLALPGNHTPLPPGQVLIHASMPCAGLGDCGVCAVKTRRGWKLACKEGPVFDLKEVIT